MRLIELDPRWYRVEDDGDRLGITFDCPHCLGSGQRLGVSFHHLGRELMEDAVIHAKRPGEHVWSLNGAESFDVLTLSPSIDASEAGHWHGFITNGAIVGGL